jgi:hypothetical protein
MTSLARTTDPATEPVTLIDAKAHLRISLDDEDELITALIVTARMAAEEYTRRALITQGWTLWMDAFPGNEMGWWDGVREGANALTIKRFIHLPRPPLIGVTAVTSYDDEDAATVFAADHYFVDTGSAPGRLALRNNAAWPVPGRTHNGISIEYTAGYGAAGDVPQALKQGMLAHIAQLYEQRGDNFSFAGQVGAIKHVPEVTAMLYQPYRIQHLILP